MHAAADQRLANSIVCILNTWHSGQYCAATLVVCFSYKHLLTGNQVASYNPLMLSGLSSTEEPNMQSSVSQNSDGSF